MEQRWMEVTLWITVLGMVGLVVVGLVMLGQYLIDYIKYRQHRAKHRRH